MIKQFQNKHILSILISIFIITGCSSPVPELVVQNVDPQFVARGKELSQGLAACGFCHGDATHPQNINLGGGREFQDKYGTVIASNITPSQSGIGTWTTMDLMQVIRSGVRREEQLLSPQVHNGYEWLSDTDTRAVIAFLRSLPPINNEIKRRDVSFVDRNTKGIFDRTREVKGIVPDINPRFQAAYGKYLVNHVARCGLCHDSEATTFTDAKYLYGGQLIKNESGEARAPALHGSTVDGLGSWTEKDILHFFETGFNPDGNAVDPRFCPVEYFKQSSLADREAIAKYLKTVPAP